MRGALRAFIEVMLLAACFDVTAPQPEASAPARAAAGDPSANMTPWGRAVAPPLMPGLLGDFNCDSVAFYKTHKTASSTVALVLDKVGAALNRRFLHERQHAIIRQEDWVGLVHEEVDFSTSHFETTFQAMAGRQRWPVILKSNPGLLTIVREPVSHYVSHFLYYSKEPKTLENLKLHLGTRWDVLQTREMVGTESRLSGFLRSELYNRTVFLLTEHLAEGMAALHLHCGWPLKDLVISHNHCAHCWDHHLTSIGTPPDLEIDAETKKVIKNLTRSDQILHTDVSRRWEVVRQKGGPALQRVAKEIELQSTTLDQHCSRVVTDSRDFLDHPGCRWYVLSETEFNGLLGADNRVDMQRRISVGREHRGYAGLPFTAGQLMEAFSELYGTLFPKRAGHPLRERAGSHGV